MKRRSLTTALLAGLTGTVGVATQSGAVNVNPDGLGQVLLSPYYTVRGETDTLISVVNTTGEAKAVKVRFLEALNSKEVLDFNLYLSPFDVWTAAVTDDGDAGRLFTADTSCTVPQIPEEGVQFRTGELDDVEFDPDPTDRNDLADNDGDNITPGSETLLDRTREGHFELIEMGVITSTTGPDANANGVGDIWEAIVHNQRTDTLNCATLPSFFTGSGFWTSGGSGIGAGVQQPSGGLFGAAQYVNVQRGDLSEQNLTAIQDFFAVGNPDADLHSIPGSTQPSLNAADTTGVGVAESQVFFKPGVGQNAMVVTDAWGLAGTTDDRPVDAVSAVLTHNTVSNEYLLEPGLGGRTDWVITMPTKRFYVNQGSDNFGTLPPFVFSFEDSTDAVIPPGVPLGPTETAPVQANLTFWDREETPEDPPEDDVDFSPSPGPQSNTRFLLWETNVLTFNDSNVFSSPQTLFPPHIVQVGDFANGWARVSFTEQNPANLGTTDPDDAVGAFQVLTNDDSNNQYQGIPVIGFGVQFSTNGDLNGTLSNYAGAFQHRATRDICGSGVGIPCDQTGT